MRSRFKRRARGEEGATLILALVFILMVASVTAALLPFTSEGGSEATNASGIRSVGNAADGAMEGAIGSLRFNATGGAATSPSCPTYTAPEFPQPLLSSTLHLTVSCKPLGTSGNVKDDQPQFSILTLDPRSSHTEGLDGLFVNKNLPLVVDGSIYSASNIDTSPETPSVSAFGGSVYAVGTCPKARATGVVHCPLSVAAGDPPIPNPGYGSVYSALPATWSNDNADPLGQCSAADPNVVTFTPGYYSQIPHLDPSTCGSFNSNKDSIWYLSQGSGPDPGVYYFDFPDRTYDPGFSNNLATWTIPDGVTLVGGTPSGWSPSSDSVSSVESKPAGTLCDPNQMGVQLVVGGPSNIAVTGTGSTGGRVEVCGSQATESSAVVSSPNQHIAVYGLNTGPSVRLPVHSPDEMPSSPTSPGPAGSPHFSTPSPGPVTPRNPATAVIPKDKSASLLLSAFPLPTDLPGALITNVALTVTHQDVGTGLSPNVIVTLGSGKQVSFTRSPSASPLVDVIDLTAAIRSDRAIMSQLTSAPRSDPTVVDAWRDLEPPNISRLSTPPSGATPQALSAQYTIANGGTADATDTVTDVQLNVSYVAPASEAVRCVSGQSTPCYLFSNTKSTTVSFAGTVYTPTAELQPTVFNDGTTLFRRGVIAKDLDVQLSASSVEAKQGVAPFQLPQAEVTSREVLLTAMFQGKPVLRADVLFIDTIVDDQGNQLLSPGASVTIKEWTVLP
jgi:hypothetical protein